MTTTEYPKVRISFECSPLDAELLMALYEIISDVGADDAPVGTDNIELLLWMLMERALEYAEFLESEMGRKPSEIPTVRFLARRWKKLSEKYKQMYEEEHGKPDD